MKNVAKCDTWCELQNPVNHRVFERKLRPKPSGRGHVCLGVTNHRYGTEADLPCVTARGWPKSELRTSEAVLEIVGREADGGRRCVLVGCGTEQSGPPIDLGRGPTWIKVVT
ncbi:unnamed protein product [Brassica rapa subsp. narinosa]